MLLLPQRNALVSMKASFIDTCLRNITQDDITKRQIDEILVLSVSLGQHETLYAFDTPMSENEAQAYWQGMTSMGASVKVLRMSCPLDVVSGTKFVNRIELWTSRWWQTLGIVIVLIILTVPNVFLGLNWLLYGFGLVVIASALAALLFTFEGMTKLLRYYINNVATHDEVDYACEYYFNGTSRPGRIFQYAVLLSNKV